MTGLVLTGNRIPEHIGGYRIIVYLLDAGYDDKLSRTLFDLYTESIKKSNIDQLAQFMSDFGLTNKDVLRDLVSFSGEYFNSFIRLLAKKNNEVVRNIRNSIISSDLKEVFKKLNDRNRISVVVGEISRTPSLSIKAYLDDSGLTNVKVVGSIKAFSLMDFGGQSLVVCDGNYICNNPHDDFEIDYDVPIFISKIKYGFDLPDFVNPCRHRIYMINDLANDINVVDKHGERFAC